MAPMISSLQIMQKDPLNERKQSEGDELRQNLAQLKLGNEECLRRKRLLGGVMNQEFETYSLPVSRVTPPPFLDSSPITRIPNEY
jgi:hypothetical protein